MKQSSLHSERSRLVDDSEVDYIVEIPAADDTRQIPAQALQSSPTVAPSSMDVTAPSTIHYVGHKMMNATVTVTPSIRTADQSDAEDILVIERPDEYEHMDMVCSEAETIQVLEEEETIVIESLEDAFSGMTEEIDKQNKIVIVIDAANVGWAYGNGIRFSPAGVILAIEYIKHVAESVLPVDVIAFLPASYMRKRPKNGSNIMGNALMETEDWDLLNDLIGKGYLALVPPGGHDDIYLLTYARLKNGFVVSNDFFTDHMNQIINPAVKACFELWLKERRSSYTFPKSDEFMLNPEWCNTVYLLFYTSKIIEAAHVFLFFVSGLSYLLRTNLTAIEDQTASSALFFGEVNKISRCRCGVYIQEVLEPLSSSLVPTHYSMDEANIVYSHLNSALNLIHMQVRLASSYFKTLNIFYAP